MFSPILGAFDRHWHPRSPDMPVEGPSRSYLAFYYRHLFFFYDTGRFPLKKFTAVDLWPTEALNGVDMTLLFFSLLYLSPNSIILGAFFRRFIVVGFRSTKAPSRAHLALYFFFTVFIYVSDPTSMLWRKNFNAGLFLWSPFALWIVSLVNRMSRT